MEQLSGVPLTDLNSIRSITSKDPETVLINALNTWFASVLGADTFHADVHAGALSVGLAIAAAAVVICARWRRALFWMWKRAYIPWSLAW